MNRWRTLAKATNKDADHDAVVALLRAHGATVVEIYKPLDLLVGYRGVTMLLEVKSPAGRRGGKSRSGQKLRDSQVEFIALWRGAPPLVVTINDCVQQMQAEAVRAAGREWVWV